MMDFKPLSSLTPKIRENERTSDRDREKETKTLRERQRHREGERETGDRLLFGSASFVFWY